MSRRALVVGLCAAVAAMTFQTIVAQAPLGSGPDARGALRGWPAQVASGPVLDAPQHHDLNLTPARISIASIHLDARVESRGLDGSHNLDTALDFHDAAWYNRGPAPGQPGNALINGHVNWWTGNAVFTYLARVRVGDRVQIVRADGVTVWFKVTATRTVDAGAHIASLFAPSSVATLTLITCAGVWNPLTLSDTQRLLVSAALVQS